MEFDHRIQTIDRNRNAEKLWRFVKVAGVSVLVGGFAVAAVPLAVSAMGFSSAGIVGGSLAARMMSWEAIFRGGGVAAGGLVSTLQRVGAVGLSNAAKTVIGTITGGLYALFSGNSEYQRRKNTINPCKICVDGEINALFMPCCHLYACHQCANLLSICPVCQQEIEEIYVIIQKKFYKLRGRENMNKRYSTRRSILSDRRIYYMFIVRTIKVSLKF
ncbi:death-associated inhibitor of apoptosis 1-like [Saccostrea cucullata]|uniref:death-associated inhibitor of apoptosis 1-like n=1 Tax=Saccostrea cuccullata TaxID=36930 RepID=UPI002ED0D687